MAAEIRQLSGAENCEAACKFAQKTSVQNTLAHKEKNDLKNKETNSGCIKFRSILTTRNWQFYLPNLLSNNFVQFDTNRIIAF